MEVLLVDNYDSFTFNLLHMLRELCGPAGRVHVVKNDRLDGVEATDYDRIVLSPGPGIPSEAGGLLGFVGRCAPVRPVLGVCLGHHAIAEFFGARLFNMPEVFHGVCSSVELLAHPYPFRGLADRIEVGRYHSWAVDGATIPDCLEVTARDEAGTVMALSHRVYDVHGVQFHPESIMTPCGKIILEHFLKGRSACAFSMPIP